MSTREQIVAKFAGTGDAEPLYLPDLTLWYDYHRKNGTLSPSWQGVSLPQIARSMGVPVWAVAETQRVMAPDVQIVTTEADGERVITSETPAGTLTARWIVGPDGAMWQTEYPVKNAADLDAVLALARARSYLLDPAYAAMAAEVGETGVLAIEIPRRPLSDLLHEYLGWAEGLMLFFEEQEKIGQIIAALEEKLQAYVTSLNDTRGEIVYSPDNLDGQFISPRMFQDHLAGSYRRTAQAVHEQGKRLVVHIGGPARHLLAPLAQADIDGLEGITGPPQGDASPAEARGLVGEQCTLWGGIAQDFLLDTGEQAALERAVEEAVQMAAADSRTIIGVADRVPVDADLERLTAMPALVENAFRKIR